MRFLFKGNKKNLLHCSQALSDHKDNHIIIKDAKCLFFY